MVGPPICSRRQQLEVAYARPRRYKCEKRDVAEGYSVGSPTVDFVDFVQR
jgi:hypothetical protein